MVTLELFACPYKVGALIMAKFFDRKLIKLANKQDEHRSGERYRLIERLVLSFIK